MTEPPLLSLLPLVSPVLGSSARPPEAPGSSVPHLRQQQHPTPPYSALEDAIVEMHFGLSHFAIAGKKGMRSKDVFVGKIDAMQVLVPPRPTSSNVMKKQVVRMHLDPNTPISKKLQIV